MSTYRITNSCISCQLNYSITTIPASGNLYQLSQVFSAYGYEPKAGSTITTPNTAVTGSLNRVYYVRPKPDLAGINAVRQCNFRLNEDKI